MLKITTFGVIMMSTLTTVPCFHSLQQRKDLDHVPDHDLVESGDHEVEIVPPVDDLDHGHVTGIALEHEDHAHDLGIDHPGKIVIIQS